MIFIKQIQFLVVFLFCNIAAYTQIAFIQDDDGFVNVRNAPKIGDNISGQYQNGDFVYISEEVGNWSIVLGISSPLWGYVHSSRLQGLDIFESIPIIENQEAKIVLSAHDVKVEIISSKFDAKSHEIQSEKNGDYIYYSKIDGERFWGEDGGIPKIEYDSIIVEVGGDRLVFSKTNFKNLYNPNLDYTEAHYDRKNDQLYLSTLNSDGAGAYGVLWIISKSELKEKYVFSPF